MTGRLPRWQGLFFVSSAVAGLVSGVVSWAVAKNLEGDLGRHAWQWLFIVEGVPTIALGLMVIFFLPGLPDQVVKSGTFGFRNPGERDLIRRRLAASECPHHLGRPRLASETEAF